VARQIRMGHCRCAKIWPQLCLTKAWSRRAEVLARSIAVLVLAWVLVLVWFVSNAGIDYIEMLVALAGTVVVIGGLFVSGVMGHISRRGSLLLCAGLLALLAAATTIFAHAQSSSNPLFLLRFALSLPALADRVPTAAGSATVQGSQWVGLFHVTRIERLNGEIRFITGMCGVIDQCGLVFRQVPPTRARGKERLQPLSGNWYHLYDVF